MKLRYNNNDEFLALISDEDSVFHYTRRSTALEKILYDDCFKLSLLVHANDPHEYKNKQIGASGWGWDASVEKNIHKTLQLLDRLINENTYFISTCKNTIESEIIKNHGCLKSRMWSQYGENHEGVCLVFSKKKLVTIITQKYKDEDYLISYGDVTYKDYVNENSRHDSVDINHDTFDSGSPKEIALQHIIKYKNEMLFCKQLDYKDEEEFRIVILKKEFDNSKNLVPEIKLSDCLVGVIIGDRSPRVYSSLLDNLSEKLGVNCRRLHWEAGEYFLLSNRG